MAHAPDRGGPPTAAHSAGPVLAPGIAGGYCRSLASASAMPSR